MKPLKNRHAAARGLVLMGCIALQSVLFAQEKYVYQANLANIEDDKVAVSLVPPAIKEAEVVFSFPKVIPGSYSEKNYGKFIDGLKAYDKDGKKLKAKKINSNQYRIKSANTLARITYKVNDTWDKPDKDFIFQPGGTNIEAGQNVVMNTYAFFGYFEGYKTLPLQIEITKPAALYASTHLQVQRNSPQQDVLLAPTYNYLADNPVFYSVPDTSSFMVGGTRINVAVISATGKVKSSQVAGYLQPMATALGQFFNGLPVSSYQFLFYFEDLEKIGRKNMGGGFGALEHNYSSLYFLPEMGYEKRLKSLVLEVSSHEFLHILTPLNLHSEEIENFDYMQPKMSAHLWLYEGVTEYFAHLTQVQNGLVTQPDFFKTMRKKINDAEDYGQFSMTEMSEHVLEKKYEPKYGSVYSKGALIALLLDIHIRDKTNGSKDLKAVVLELTKKYGPGKPFKDSELFADFVAASHPSVQAFINDYIIGDKPLPYQPYFEKIGYEYLPLKKTSIYYSGYMAVKYDDSNQTFVLTQVNNQQALPLQNNDVVVSIEGTAVTADNLEPLWEKYFSRNTQYPTVSITITRNGVEKTIAGPLLKGFMESKNSLEPMEATTAAQQQLLEALVKGK